MIPEVSNPSITLLYFFVAIPNDFFICRFLGEESGYFQCGFGSVDPREQKQIPSKPLHTRDRNGNDNS
jgi:hypothetical protein